MPAIDVVVPSEDLSYQVLVEGGVLARVGTEVRRAAPKAKRAALISDDNVMPLYGERVAALIGAEGIEVSPWSIPAGEASKTPANLLDLVGKLVDAGLSRQDVVVALGGGVVGDLAGLVAGTFMRGVALVQCPTSLLAQVDASVGGKVAVDLPQGKNLLGAFHFPMAVLIDPEVLTTLPDGELACGLAEMLKHGALFDPLYFEEVQADADAIYRRKAGILVRLVATSVALKAACVSRDPLELSAAGKGRVLLNLGHTVGHAIEAASAFGVRHGEAVGLGLVAAARVSARRGLGDEDLEPRIVHALTNLRLPTDLDRWLRGPKLDAVVAAMRSDKKRAKNTVTYIGLAALGDPRVFALDIDELVTSLVG
jgi:3-dehydroquinate synthase